MQKLWLLLLAVLLVAGSAGTSLAEMEHFPGEGYAERSAKSLEEYKPSLSTKTRASTGVNDIRVTPNPNLFPNISVFMTVRDADGNQIRGLTAADIAVTEQSETEGAPVAQTISNFKEETGMTGTNVMLVIDVSGSMWGQRMTDAQRAAIDFVNSMGPNDRVGLVSFESAVKIERPMDWVNKDSNNSGVYDIIEAIDSLYPSGMTAMYDGAYEGIANLTQEAFPKAVILLGDGDENWSRSSSINDVVALAQNENIPVYTIGFHISPGSRAYQQLNQIATGTNGRYYGGASFDDMKDIYQEIRGAVSSQYSFEYTTHNPLFDGTTRTVTVAYNNSTGNATYVVNYRPQIELDAATLDLSKNNQPVMAPLNIAGKIVDKDDNLPDVQAMLYYRTLNHPAYVSKLITLTNAGNGEFAFNAQIPGPEVQSPGIEYYIWATDGKVEVYSPRNYSESPHMIPVGNNLPVISHTPVTTGSPNSDIPISATVTDPDGDMIDSVKLFYRVTNPAQKTAYHSVDMVSGGMGYTANIPGSFITEDGVDYYISAWDSHMARADHGSADAPHRIVVQKDVTKEYGAILVNIEPEAARQADAEWRRVGSQVWNGYWTPESNVPVGQHELEFKEVPGFMKPANQTVTVTANQVVVTMVNYQAGTGGSLLVNIEPQAARQDGAAWRRVGTQEWFDAWTPESNIPSGMYSVECKDVQGWNTPAPIDIEIRANELTIGMCTYMPEQGGGGGGGTAPTITDRMWIASFYVAYWNRAPDPDGLNYWLSQVGSGSVDIAGVAENFGQSDEAKDMYQYFRNPANATEADIQAFVRGVYRNLLNREPDAAGQDYWVDVLKRGDSTPGVVIGNIINAAILQVTMGNPMDWKIIDNKIQVALYFTDRFIAQGRVWNNATDLTLARTALNHVSHDPVTVDAAKARIDVDLPANNLF